MRACTNLPGGKPFALFGVKRLSILRSPYDAPARPYGSRRSGRGGRSGKSAADASLHEVIDAVSRRVGAGVEEGVSRGLQGPSAQKRGRMAAGRSGTVAEREVSRG